ncbi:TetR/AcrR family transcriptional regulator [Swaminathania salitolerans]|uniref:Putative TetR-family transcriptional regulator n=1 Tax=Swaminathania salitolerans TaxID=182838 RepID=A0A511BMZ6_9PROT|nr:TetR-like C-terminal domain-containing protein [Swaminathania salitolerans]GBQ16210.1 TetR family transcriptional regulator [Swaminathania salitolerans LMG 21291]GEL01635.1 putative TetR-family transcriptional regulator [Swaminathania salitolerans]
MTEAKRPSYHHGDLPAALLRSARQLLETGGISTLKLRAITRHAGVSATAAAPHFGSLSGLLSALAAQGFLELASVMAPEHAPTPRDVALAYVRFAIASPGLFTLMFRSDAIDRQDPALRAASERAFARLAGLSAEAAPEARAATMIALWGKVHGVAVLATDGLLGGIAAESGAQTLDRLLEQVFR